MRFGLGGACLVGIGLVGCHLIADVDDLTFGDSSSSSNTGGNGGAGPTSVTSVGGSGATGGFSSSSSAGGTIGVIPAPDAYWFFDGVAPSSTADFVVQDHAPPMTGLDLTCTKSVKGVAAGKIAGSVELDGNNSVHCARSHANVDGTALQLEGNTPLSISVGWNTDEGDGGTLLSKKSADAPNKGLVVGISKSSNMLVRGTLGLVLATSEATPEESDYVRSETPYDDGIWHHALVVYDGSTKARGVLIYVDGALIKLKVVSDLLPVAGDINAESVPFIVGRQGADSDLNEKYPYKGQLDDIAIWKETMLNPDQAAEIHSQGNKGNALSTLWATEL